jgi:hypothetical protein
MTWISFVLWVVLAPALAGDAGVEVGVLVHDPATDTMAALRLSDRPHVDDDEIRDGKRTLVVRVPSVVESVGVGTGTGSEPALAMLAELAPTWRLPLAAMLAGTSAAVFEGQGCEGCAVAQRGGVAVIGVGIAESEAEAIASRVAAVGGDAVERLLAVANDGHVWPHRRGPSSATIVVIGPDRARESIAVDRGKVGRRLIDRHLRHLASVELPYQLERAQKAWKDGDEAALEVHRRRALAAARRALEAFPTDAVLHQRLRAAEALRPEHDIPTP